MDVKVETMGGDTCLVDVGRQAAAVLESIDRDGQSISLRTYDKVWEQVDCYNSSYLTAPTDTTCTPRPTLNQLVFADVLRLHKERRQELSKNEK